MNWTLRNGMRGLATAAAAFALSLSVAASAHGAPILVSATLAGDGRLQNPDNLSIAVTISGDTTSNLTSWLVDLTMGAPHPSAALHEFYFNLLGSSADYTFSNFSLGTWSVTDIDVTNAQGSGGADFMFELSGPNNTITNTTSLSFDVTKNTGLFTVADFLLASQGCSREAALGCGQLGAHIGSLGAAGSGSGFALGIYGSRTPVNPVPEPGSLTLLGLGMAGLLARLRQKRSRA